MSLDDRSTRERAFDDLYRDHHRAVYAFLLSKVGDKETAVDLLQEVFVKTWASIDQAQAIPAERRRYWLLAVAGNTTKDQRRRSIVREKSERALRLNLVVAELADPVDELRNRERVETLDRAIGELPEDLRTVLTMSALADMTSTEIGRALGRPAGTVRYQLGEARRRLACRLGLDATMERKPNE